MVAAGIAFGIASIGLVAVPAARAAPAGPPGGSPTTLTTILQAGERSGVQLDTLVGAPVTDSATLDGYNAETATGTVTYNVYSDSACTQLAAAGTPQQITTPGQLPGSQPVSVTWPGAYYWQAAYSGDSANGASASTCGIYGEVEYADPGEDSTSVSTVLSGGGHSGPSVSVPAGTAVTDTATLSVTSTAIPAGAVRYNVYSDAACTVLAQAGASQPLSSSGAPAPSAPVTLRTPGTYYWQAQYSGDQANAGSSSPCGPQGEVETVTVPPTTLTTSLSGGGKSGASITVPAGTAVKDSGTLSGANARTATGTVTYTVYSDPACGHAVSAGRPLPVAGGGAIPDSAPVTLTTPGTYYWRLAYPGDSRNGASLSTCGTRGEVETVTVPPPATSLATTLTGAGHSGARLLVPSGQPASDVATLSGKNAARATGTMTFRVYSDGKCTKLIASLAMVLVASGKAASARETLAAGTYYWTASYSGDTANRASASPCGSEVLTVKAAAGRPGAAPVIDTVTSTSAKTSATAKVRTTVPGDLVVAFVAGTGPVNRRQASAVSGGGMTWYLISRPTTPGNDSEVWAALPSGKLSNAVITAKASISGFDEILMVVAFKGATGIGPEAFAHATSGAPKASLKTTVSNSWVFGLGTDWRRFASRVPGAGQLIFAQEGSVPAKATTWIQAPANVTPKAGTTVPINDTAPANDPYNLLLVAIQ